MNPAPRLVVVLATLFAVTAWADHARPPSGTAYPPVAQQTRAQQLDARLQRAQAALEAALDHSRDRRRAVREALEEITAARAELSVVGPFVPAPALEPWQPTAMRAETFSALVAALDRERNPEDQLRVLGNAIEGNFFHSSQAQTLLSRFSFDAVALHAAGLVARRLVDPNNAFLLYGQLNGSFDKQVMQQLLAGADANRLVVAASDAQLRALTSAVFQPWGPSDRLKVLSARAGDQLLTAAQLRGLLDGFWAPQDRLAALQVMKRRLIDPRNAEVIAQAFWSPHEQREARRLLAS